MPQMAPMSWLTLFIFFSVLFTVTIILNFYFYLYKMNNNYYLSPKKKSLKIKIWKW
uniref:ATP synthase complex subunit 8 n=1 Tax=Pityogenes bidentatus TaxID=1325381 RepID=A0A2D0VPE5_9CUCU|nr:ATP synthase F0 subunit 8 [Pityogenes bidentatus]AOY40166.1 ATP synthase F0 subunit 8 [Pityogenes bidentatus]